jgi:hypothetical protein
VTFGVKVLLFENGKKKECNLGATIMNGSYRSMQLQGFEMIDLRRKTASVRDRSDTLMQRQGFGVAPCCIHKEKK